jgi:hypothetical protein
MSTEDTLEEIARNIRTGTANLTLLETNTARRGALLLRVKNGRWHWLRNRRLLAEAHRLATENHDLCQANRRLLMWNDVLMASYKRDEWAAEVEG